MGGVKAATIKPFFLNSRSIYTNHANSMMVIFPFPRLSLNLCPTLHAHRRYLFLLKYPVNPEHVVQDFIEQYKWDVELLFIEDLEPCVDILPQLLLVYCRVVLGEPVGEQNGTAQGSLEIIMEASRK